MKISENFTKYLKCRKSSWNSQSWRNSRVIQIFRELFNDYFECLWIFLSIDDWNFENILLNQPMQRRSVERSETIEYYGFQKCLLRLLSIRWWNKLSAFLNSLHPTQQVLKHQETIVSLPCQPYWCQSPEKYNDKLWIIDETDVTCWNTSFVWFVIQIVRVLTQTWVHGLVE